MINQIENQTISVGQDREKPFKLSLPAWVKGIDVSNREFKEKTRIFHMSAQEAIFGLNKKVIIGSKLMLLLNIPRTLILEKPLTLSVSGIVHLVKTKKQYKKRQLVALSLDKKYRILSHH
ncbi:MAG: hypothetical protein WCC06_07130 [Candidatus Aminicenantales bacterium]